MDTNSSGGLAARFVEWGVAFGSDDPGLRWAAACSVACAVTVADRWIDSTAMHEAACGAYDAAAEAARSDPVPAAIAGARRALYWERQERTRLVPPADLGVHRWRALRAAGGSEGRGTLIALDPAIAVSARPTMARVASPTAALLGDRLGAAGWPWPPDPGQAVDDAIEAVIDAGRDRAAATLIQRQPRLPRCAADGLVLLVAGSRRRLGRAWPGVVWLQAHLSIDAALEDPGTTAVIDAIVDGRRVRPTVVGGATILTSTPQRHNDPATARTTGQARAVRPARQAVAS